MAEAIYHGWWQVPGHAKTLNLDVVVAGLPQVRVAYETWGELDDEGTNVVLIIHAMTGNSHVTAHHENDVPGWWEEMVGPGRPIDTQRWFVVCANVLGGCHGSTGPSAPYLDTAFQGPQFPQLCVDDMVQAYRGLVRALGLRRPLAAVVGGSFGAMQALEWLIRYPADALSFGLVAPAIRHTAENVAYHAVGRFAISRAMERATGPDLYAEDLREAMVLARIAATISYLAPKGMAQRFGRHETVRASTHLERHFSIESYLRHNASRFGSSFDPMSYSVITSAMDSFDPFSPGPWAPEKPLQGRAMIMTFASDRLYGLSHSREIESRLGALGIDTEHYIDETSQDGHDSFLKPSDDFKDNVTEWLFDLDVRVAKGYRSQTGG